MFRSIISHILPCRSFDPCDLPFCNTNSHTAVGRRLEILCVLQLYNVQWDTHTHYSSDSLLCRMYLCFVISISSPCTAFFGTWRCIAAFRRACHRTLFWKKLMQFTFPYSAYFDPLVAARWSFPTPTGLILTSPLILVDGSRESKAGTSPSGIRTSQVPDNNGHV